MNTAPKIMISGGGTGGHIFPAIAIGQAIRNKYPAAKITYVGAQGRMEMEKVPAAGFSIHGLWISGFQRSQLWKNWNLPFKIIKSIWQAYRLVKQEKPDVTIGVGGYASGPLNYVAASMGVPLLLQEQNSYPGVTNKILKNKASKICVAYPEMERYFPKEKIVITGNPIRQELLSVATNRAEALNYFSLNPSKKTILVLGGSLGARTINDAIENAISQFENEHIQLLWQTGKNYKGEFGMHSWGVCTAFIQRMDMAYATADLVISRAGASSISELAMLGKATIFVPSPFVAEDHQTKNALALVKHGAALLCKDADAKENLASITISTLSDQNKLVDLQKNIFHFAQPQATELILAEIEQLWS